MIIGRDLMVQLGPTTNFQRQLIKWYGATVHMKEPISLLGQSNLTKQEMRKVLMKTAEPDCTQESTEQMAKILDITYVKS